MYTSIPSAYSQQQAQPVLVLQQPSAQPESSRSEEESTQCMKDSAPQPQTTPQPQIPCYPCKDFTKVLQAFDRHAARRPGLAMEDSFVCFGPLPGLSEATFRRITAQHNMPPNDLMRELKATPDNGWVASLCKPNGTTPALSDYCMQEVTPALRRAIPPLANTPIQWTHGRACFSDQDVLRVVPTTQQRASMKDGGNTQTITAERNFQVTHFDDASDYFDSSNKPIRTLLGHRLGTEPDRQYAGAMRFCLIDVGGDKATQEELEAALHTAPVVAIAPACHRI